jgi:hypothetical protein
MLRKLIALLCLGASQVFASQAFAQVDVTGEGRSYARVDLGVGRIAYLDHPQAGYGVGFARFIVRINNKYYSNSEYGIWSNALPFPAGTYFIGRDTLSTEWKMDGCKIRLIVYPYRTGDEYKIVTRIFATALQDSVVVEPQAILNTQQAPLGYLAVSRRFDTVPGHLAFMSGRYQPEAYWRFPSHPVLEPREMIFAELTDISNYPAWSDKPVDSEILNSFAINAIWDSQMLAPGVTKEIASFMFGAAEYVSCEDSLSALLFYPRRLSAVTDDSASRILPLHVYFKSVQPYLTPNYWTIKASGGLAIVGYSLAEYPDSTLRIHAKDHLPFGWRSDTSIDLIADINTPPNTTQHFEVGLSPKQGPAYVTGCKFWIGITEHAEKDLTPATILDVTRDREGLGCTSQRDVVIISDLATTADEGIKSIEHTETNYTVQFTTKNEQFSHSESLLLNVIDSMIDGHVSFKVIDGADHITIRQIDYCTTPDVRKPAIREGGGYGDWRVTVSDDRPWDRKLRSVELLDAIDVDTSLTFSGDSATAIFRIYPRSSVSSFKAYAIDRAGNVSDTIYRVAPPFSSVKSSRSATGSEVAVVGEYLILKRSKAGSAQVIDVLGRTVMEQSLLLGEDRIPISALPSGRYFLRSGDETIPFMIER